MTFLYGPAVAPASLSPHQAKAEGLLTSGTFGQTSTGSSSSAALQRSLASKLQARLAETDSTLYRMTWKESATPLGRQFCQLVASVPRISGRASFSALPTPCARDYRGHMSMENLERRKSNPRGVNLQEFMQRAVGRPGYLNPELPRLLMGLPPEWCEHAPMATRLMQRSQPLSSKAG